MNDHVNYSLLNDYIEEYERLTGISGILRVTEKEKIVYEKFFGYADREKRTEFCPESVFTFYSLSKPFLTIGFLRLVDEGIIKLDSHPGVYVPEAAGFDKRVTFRNMLHHESGLPDFEQSPGAKSRFSYRPARRYS